MIPAFAASPPFPGAIYTAHLLPMTPAAPQLTRAIMDSASCRAVISNDQPATYGLVWVLLDDARYAEIPRHWLDQAATEGGQGVGLLDLPISRDTGRCPPVPGRGILLLARDPDAHQDVRRGLERLFQLVGTPRWQMVQA